MFNKIDELISLGYNVHFLQVINQLQIVLTCRGIKRQSCLPKRIDHMNEGRILAAINFMQSEIETEINELKP